MSRRVFCHFCRARSRVPIVFGPFHYCAFCERAVPDAPETIDDQRRCTGCRYRTIYGGSRGSASLPPAERLGPIISTMHTNDSTLTIWVESSVPRNGNCYDQGRSVTPGAALSCLLYSYLNNEATPSTKSVTPVIASAASEQRKTLALATCSAVCNLPSGIPFSALHGFSGFSGFSGVSGGSGHAGAGSRPDHQTYTRSACRIAR